MDKYKSARLNVVRINREMMTLSCVRSSLRSATASNSHNSHIKDINETKTQQQKNKKGKQNRNTTNKEAFMWIDRFIQI